MPLSRLIIYARDPEEMARFYAQHFDFKARQWPGDRIIELVAQDGGANIMLHAAARGQRMGQAAIKLVFDVEDVAGFKARSAALGVRADPRSRRLPVRQCQGSLPELHPDLQPRLSARALK